MTAAWQVAQQPELRELAADDAPIDKCADRKAVPQLLVNQVEAVTGGYRRLQAVTGGAAAAGQPGGGGATACNRVAAV